MAQKWQPVSATTGGVGGGGGGGDAECVRRGSTVKRWDGGMRRFREGGGSASRQRNFCGCRGRHACDEFRVWSGKLFTEQTAEGLRQVVMASQLVDAWSRAIRAIARRARGPVAAILRNGPEILPRSGI